MFVHNHTASKQQGKVLNHYVILSAHDQSSSSEIQRSKCWMWPGMHIFTKLLMWIWHTLKLKGKARQKTDVSGHNLIYIVVHSMWKVFYQFTSERTQLLNTSYHSGEKFVLSHAHFFLCLLFSLELMKDK